ncbi:hypothetical protein BU14_0166s0015 [Porphyra umbilicalis]|uniref:Uncharacterized protein n=1 Tax=Porphyra umbilicalis TaxID=2786 RepID=A0A1X6P897_PORUM|nr:hypothetical protein BU14_0166s0015 [Porphyra umbilicalis]|eukprot:OSX76975.1 hypothetical protein BU14_0166s0015 [Porphyra umbilicalis]
MRGTYACAPTLRVFPTSVPTAQVYSMTRTRARRTCGSSIRTSPSVDMQMGIPNASRNRHRGWAVSASTGCWARPSGF